MYKKGIEDIQNLQSSKVLLLELKYSNQTFRMKMFNPNFWYECVQTKLSEYFIRTKRSVRNT